MTHPKLKALAAAMTLSLSGLASAAPIDIEGLFFSATNGNSGAPSSIVINLLETTTDFRANADLSRVLFGPSLDTLSQWLGLQTDLSTVRWNIAGASIGDAFSDPPSVLYGGLSTSTNLDTLPEQGSGSFNGLDQVALNFADFRTNKVNANLASTNAFFAANQNQYFTPSSNGGANFASVGGVGESLPFYAFFADQGDNAGFEGDFTKFAGSWTLGFDAGAASLSYVVPAPVPVPGAVWLLGSAMAGLAGIARRRVG